MLEEVTDELLSPEFLASLSKDDKDKIIKEIDDELRSNFGLYEPYPKQLEFHNCLALERVLSGANQVGKSVCAGMETAFHCTGIYPNWFKGDKIRPRYNEQAGLYEMNIWVLGTSYDIVRDLLQKRMIGSKDSFFKDGNIPVDAMVLKKFKTLSGVPGFVNYAVIKHRGFPEEDIPPFECTVKFKSYSQGKTVLQSEPVDFIYLDEEPPGDIVSELKARLSATGGKMIMAFTPLQGMTALVQEFWNQDDKDKALFTMSIYEVPHMTPEKIRMAEKRYKSAPAHVRKARLEGIPSMGTGQIYPFSRSELEGTPPNEGIRLPWLGAIDFGKGSHQNSVLYGCHDTARDVIYITHDITTQHKSREEVASKMRRYKEWCPIAYPHDGGMNSGTSQTSKDIDYSGVGFTVKQIYKQEKINMLEQHATFEAPASGFNVEPGLEMIRDRMSSGRLKIAPWLDGIFDEIAIYRYGEDGKPLKVKGSDKDNDRLDALRYLVMMIRFAETKSFTEGEAEGETCDSTDIFE